MPWKESAIVNQRMQLVAGYLAGQATVTELCYKAEISRKTAYKWIGRYMAHGPEGLGDRSRARHVHPNALEGQVITLFLKARKAHPTWGPRKLIAWLSKKNPMMPMPA
jgi:putative transposase